MQEHFDDRIDAWSAEFAESPEALAFSPEMRERSRAILLEFLRGATRDGSDVGALEEADVRRGLVDHVGKLALDGDTRRETPELIAAFLSMLSRQGRLAGGGALAARARALAGSVREANAAPIRRGYTKLGLNDPCPCGSGKKWKKCCKRAFGE